MGKASLSSFVIALINIGCYGTTALLVLSVCLLAIAPWIDPPRLEVGLAVPAAFKIDLKAHPLRAAPSGVGNVHMEEARASLRFSPRDRSFVAGTAIGLILVFALILWVLMQLRSVFRTVRAGHPFVAANAKRIRWIACSVILGELVRALFVYAGMHYAMTHFSMEGLWLEARLDLSVVTIVCGLILLVIAEVFREGTRLEEEQSLTV